MDESFASQFPFVEPLLDEKYRLEALVDFFDEVCLNKAEDDGFRCRGKKKGGWYCNIWGRTLKEAIYVAWDGLPEYAKGLAITREEQ